MTINESTDESRDGSDVEVFAHLFMHKVTGFPCDLLELESEAIVSTTDQHVKVKWRRVQEGASQVLSQASLFSALGQEDSGKAKLDFLSSPTHK